MNNYYTLITGGSTGIGKALAMECARRTMNLLLVALPDKDLNHTAEDIRRDYGVVVHTMGIDLTDKDAPKKIYSWCKDNGYVVNILVNNAGLAGSIEFINSTYEYNDLRIQLNIRAMVCLTHLFIKDLIAINQSHILNTGSLSAFYSIPYKSVYSASKAFVLRFTKALNAELRNTSVSITVLCPNGVRTNPETHRRISTHGLLSRLLILPADKTARIAIDKMLKRKTIVIPGFFNRILLIITVFIPARILERRLKVIFKKEVFN
jgi:short-subunit dehydrogenase